MGKETNAKRLKEAGYYKEKVVAKNIERTKHGHSRRSGKTRTYRIWVGLPHRKYETGPICERWQEYSAFLEDMGECPSLEHTIDRIDNSLGYNPENCRWATQKEQQNNRTNNRRITIRGVTMTLQQWGEKTGINSGTIASRLDTLGWSPAEAISRKAWEK